jgi:hypothetical protein
VSAQFRPAEHYVHGIDGPVAIITGRVAALLDRHVDLGRLRIEVRGQDAEFDSGLVALAVAGATWRSSATGNASAAEPEPGAQWFSTTAAGARLGITDRAVRKAAADNRLTATLLDGRWRISAEAIEHYRAARRAA